MGQPTLDSILETVRSVNAEYEKRGFRLMGVFGSYARESADPFSDIDIAYRIDHDRFHPDDAFAKLEEIETIRRNLERKLHRRVDLVPYPRESDSPLARRLRKELKSA
jgi:predicted nucleotidyltransferase